MRLIFLLILCFGFTSSNAQSQTIKKQICSHAWQQRPTSIIWNFKENGDFSAILFWSNKRKFGFTAKKGTFSLDDSTKLLKVTFDSTYNVYSKDSFSVSKDSATQEWHLIKVTDDKLVISRPPVWEFEKRNVVDTSGNILVTLDGVGKKKINLKQKR